MPENKIQTYENHRRLDPPFHYFVFPVAAITLLAAIYCLVRDFTLFNAWLAVAAAAFLVAAILARTYPLKVQDRVIRIEETMRMQRVLAEPLRSRIGELSVGQMVALRFAPDGELAGLVEQTLANAWTKKQIKKAIRGWRADEFRV